MSEENGLIRKMLEPPAPPPKVKRPAVYNPGIKQANGGSRAPYTHTPTRSNP